MCAQRSYIKASKGNPRDVQNAAPIPKTYYFQGDVAFTEDNILIKKLFLFNVAPELLPKQVAAYFKKFGQVERVQLFGPTNASKYKYSGDRHKTKTGYVYYSDPKSAAKAIRRTVHYMNRNHRLCVQPSDSWHQPDIDAEYRQASASTPNEPPAPIMILNDHCLEHILRFLSLPDRIRFARTCVRFEDVYLQVSPSLDKCVKFEDFIEMTMWDVRDFFKLSGQNIRHLEGVIPTRHSKRIFEFLGAHCINLQKLSITGNKLTARNMYKTFDNMKQLQYLRLRACELTNGSLSALGNLPELKTLDLSNNSMLTGMNMMCLPVSIESLTLTCCTGLQLKLLANFCRTLKNLKELHMKGIYTIGSGFKKLMSAKCCKSLETITVSDGSDHSFTPMNQYEYIAKLPTIKNITVYCNEEDTVRSELIVWLAEFRSNDIQRLELRGLNCITTNMLMYIGRLTALQTLKLPNNEAIDDRGMELLTGLPQLEAINLKHSPRLTDSAVLRLILGCPKLKILHLDYCPLLTAKLLTDIIFQIRRQIRLKETERSLPIKMNLYGCRLDKSIVKSDDVAAKDIIDLTIALPAPSDMCFFDMSELLLNEEPFYLSDADMNRFNMYDIGYTSDEIFSEGEEDVFDDSFENDYDSEGEMYYIEDPDIWN